MHTIQTESPGRKGIPATTVVLALLCVMYALNYMVRVNVSTAAGAFKDQLHLSNTDLGWIFSAFAYPYLACQILKAIERCLWIIHNHISGGFHCPTAYRAPAFWPRILRPWSRSP